MPCISIFGEGVLGCCYVTTTFFVIWVGVALLDKLSFEATLSNSSPYPSKHFDPPSHCIAENNVFTYKNFTFS